MRNVPFTVIIFSGQVGVGFARRSPPQGTEGSLAKPMTKGY
jgi:hypothetical protein